MHNEYFTFQGTSHLWSIPLALVQDSVYHFRVSSYVSMHYIITVSVTLGILKKHVTDSLFHFHRVRLAALDLKNRRCRTLQHSLITIFSSKVDALKWECLKYQTLAFSYTPSEPFLWLPLFPFLWCSMAVCKNTSLQNTITECDRNSTVKTNIPLLRNIWLYDRITPCPTDITDTANTHTQSTVLLSLSKGDIFWTLSVYLSPENVNMVGC